MKKVRVVTTSDPIFVKNIRQKLKENSGYCPCKLVKNEDTKCMCKEFREMIENNIEGQCHCGLYATIKE